MIRTHYRGHRVVLVPSDDASLAETTLVGLELISATGHTLHGYRDVQVPLAFLPALRSGEVRELDIVALPARSHLRRVLPNQPRAVVLGITLVGGETLATTPVQWTALRRRYALSAGILLVVSTLLFWRDVSFVANLGAAVLFALGLRQAGRAESMPASSTPPSVSGLAAP